LNDRDALCLHANGPSEEPLRRPIRIGRFTSQKARTSLAAT
jgi:hypothetical protein